MERAQAAPVLAQKTYERARILTEQGNAPQARLDQTTDALHESERAVDQATSAYQQAVNGYTKEERAIASTSVEKANADIQSVQSIIDQLVVYAPVASQVYQRNVEPGEYVSAGRAARDVDRPEGRLDPLRSARGSGQGFEGGRQVRCPYSRAR